jgi:hypothetical protein
MNGKRYCIAFQPIGTKNIKGRKPIEILPYYHQEEGTENAMHRIVEELKAKGCLRIVVYDTTGNRGYSYDARVNPKVLDWKNTEKRK